MTDAAPPILVTGASGWLGGRLVRSLVEGLADLPDLPLPGPGARIRCLLQNSDDESVLRALSPRVEIRRGDLRLASDAKAFCRGAEGGLLYHCAGLIHPALFTRDFDSVNVRGGAHLLEAARESEIRRAVVVSSNSPLGANPDREHLFDEASPYRPYMGYGRSKMRLEELAARHGDAGDFETVVVRPPWFYGPPQPARQTEFFEMIRRGRVPLVGGGGNLRSMVYVDNLCQGLLLCGESARARGQTYWIADRWPYAMSQIVDTIERVMAEDFGFRVSGRRIRVPNIVSDVAWLGDLALQAAGLYVQKLHVLSEMNMNIACSIAKAETELGYAPGIDLEEGMRRSLQWCVDTGALDPDSD